MDPRRRVFESVTSGMYVCCKFLLFAYYATLHVQIKQFLLFHDTNLPSLFQVLSVLASGFGIEHCTATIDVLPQSSRPSRSASIFTGFSRVEIQKFSTEGRKQVIF